MTRVVTTATTATAATAPIAIPAIAPLLRPVDESEEAVIVEVG